ncbi:MAG: hypothetical protein P0Y65_18410 [Candidatus Devosia phytovorans]|uniref:Uncharacterized protein n=1 Tax=Candidatus Devosia phytovorans TaxID=3121372 RepID=A0AAJ6AZS1_9HYPH|nr:hypothetical protein [Devosia sp.]WEK04131.1 MAG: hypothetical protein P0Y65_18410 [Devosia sp.]
MVKKVSWARGFLRLWMVLAVLWCGIVGLFSYPQVMMPRAPNIAYVYEQGKEAPHVILTSSSDYATADDGDYKRYEIEVKDEYYTKTYFFFPRGLADDAYEVGKIEEVMGGRFEDDRAAAAQPVRLGNLVSLLSTTVLPPLVVLFLGICLAWVLGGFRSRPSISTD